MKEKKKIPLKRFIVLIGVCALFLPSYSLSFASQETFWPAPESEEPVISDASEELSVDDIREDSFIPSDSETETKADLVPGKDPLLLEDFPGTDEDMTEDAAAMGEKICPPAAFPVVPDCKEENGWETEETMTEKETEEQSEVSGKRACVGPFELPVGKLSGFLVTWTNAGGDLIYSNDRGEIAGSPADIPGTYTLRVEIICGEDCTALEPGTSYTYQLDWPIGDEVSVNLSEHHKDIVYNDPAKDKEVYIGSWTLDDEGLLTLTLDDNEEAAAVSRWEGYFAVQVFVSSAFDEPAQSAAIEKESHYDPASQRITWTIRPYIPAYLKGGICSSWYIDDEITVALGTVLENDMADVYVTGSSGGFDGEIPSYADASADCPIAYALENPGTSKVRLYFLTPCTCKKENCQNDQNGCANILGTGPDGRAWCSCWDYRYNTGFTITYSVDVAPVLQKLADSLNLEVSTLVVNQVLLYENGEIDQGTTVRETLKNVIGKIELNLPNGGNDYTASYRITVNPKEEDYHSADVLTITDVMTNLCVVADSLAVTAGNDISLKLQSDAVISALPREGNEDRYFSLEVSEAQDDGEGVPLKTLQIRIWYPTNQTYTITYDALVVDPELGRDGSYSNQAVFGDVSVLTTGKGSWAENEWDGKSNAVTLIKIDAEDGDLGLPGAKFEVWQYEKDKTDTLVTTLQTDGEGRAVFQTDRRTGFVVKTNTLYYLRETLAPPGYVCGEDKIWFCLLSPGTAGIPAGEMPAELLDEAGMIREDADLHMEEIPKSGHADLVLEIENLKETPEGTELPETGGCGIIPGAGSSLILFSAAAFLVFSGQKGYFGKGEVFKCRKREKS